MIYTPHNTDSAAGAVGLVGAAVAENTAPATPAADSCLSIDYCYVTVSTFNYSVSRQNCRKLKHKLSFVIMQIYLHSCCQHFSVRDIEKFSMLNKQVFSFINENCFTLMVQVRLYCII